MSVWLFGRTVAELGLRREGLRLVGQCPETGREGKRDVAGCPLARRRERLTKEVCEI